MKVNQKKANQIMGMFATLNKIELDTAKDKHEKNNYDASFISFECVIEYCGIWKCFTCELISRERFYGHSYLTGTTYAQYSSGYRKPVAQFIWERDPCTYEGFEYVVRFARNAIRAGGLSNMKHVSHKVTVDMPDYLSFETKEL
ncbi:hypothetical protein NVP1076O_64 [Vibrio phage 1.076.O._10N.286.51.B7]|nr:hypothetical protein NVP1076O_64 [Vibrio phage 1.076.O._10N.286.51.B7]